MKINKEHFHKESFEKKFEVEIFYFGFFGRYFPYKGSIRRKSRFLAVLKNPRIFWTFNFFDEFSTFFFIYETYDIFKNFFCDFG